MWTTQVILPVSWSAPAGPPSASPMYARPSPIARPRVWPKNERDTIASSILGTYAQIRSPVVALSFQTVDGFVDTYILPSITSGVLWRAPPRAPRWAFSPRPPRSAEDTTQ